MKKEIRDLVEKMTLEEKVDFISGADFWRSQDIDRLDIPKIMMCDGPHGLRKQAGEGDHLGINDSIETVCYPTASALAASFDCELLLKLGEILGKECQAEEVGMLLGPGLNMKRSPLCGRNFEYFSEDPYLTGKLAVSYVDSLQKQGIAACVKHFAANNQEAYRMSGSSNVDERTLHEVYLPAFEMAVKEGGTRGIMCAYNRINEIFCSENKELLTDILRDDWGYDGFVVTDWGAGKDPVKGIKAGLDLIMPGDTDTYKNIVFESVEKGELKVAELDKAVSNILKFVLDAQYNQMKNVVIDREKCKNISEELAVQCAVLLKNEGVLPLAKNRKTAFIGEFAKKPRYQGCGSSYINVAHAVGALEATDDCNVIYGQGYNLQNSIIDDALMEEAVKIAQDAETAVVFAGLPNDYEVEGVDRDTLDIPANQNALIEAVAQVQPNTVVVLYGGAPMALPWIDKVKTILCMYLGGQQVGNATVKLLYGDENPSGKLAETWPVKLTDNPSYLNFPGIDGNVDYKEGIYIGYRYYDKKEMKVQFPFGFGISYTSYEYSGIKVDKENLTDHDLLTVSCKIKNTGDRKGKEVVQLYVRDEESSVGRPIRELKGFTKIELDSGEEKEIVFTLNKRSFAYYEPEIHDWFVESGNFMIEIGASSRDIRLSKMVSVEGTVEIPVHYTASSPMSLMHKTAKGRAVMQQMMQSISKAAKSDSGKSEEARKMGEGGDKMMRAMMKEMPLGALVSYGMIAQEQLMQILNMLNGTEV